MANANFNQMTERLRKEGLDACRSPTSRLIELLVSISIIAILTALLLPAVQQARASSRRARRRG
jgi:Tfp pilus assembly protein FimT